MCINICVCMCVLISFLSDNVVTTRSSPGDAKALPFLRHTNAQTTIHVHKPTTIIHKSIQSCNTPGLVAERTELYPFYWIHWQHVGNCKRAILILTQR